MREKTHELALAGMLSALAVVLLWFSGFMPLATYGWPILASLTLIPARRECRTSYAWCAFFAGALLGALICADKEAAMVYCFLGYYPLLKPRFDAIRPAALRSAAKLSLCVLTMGTLYLLLIFVFKLDAVVQEVRSTEAWLIALTCLLGLVLFFFYDLVLARAEGFYERRRGCRR